MNISREWTNEERLQVVAKIAAELRNHSIKRGDEKAIAMSDRLFFLAQENSKFLEVNRDGIIGEVV